MLVQRRLLTLRPQRLTVGLLLLCSSCAPKLATIETVRDTTLLFSAATVLQHDWQHFPLRGETDYKLVSVDGRVAIRAVGKNSASGLLCEVRTDIEECAQIEWAWRVDKMQPDADIRTKEYDDVAASIFLLFGDPGPLFNLKPVPTLRYVWTNSRVGVDEIIDNPYMPGIVKNVVVRTGHSGTGRWFIEKRDFVQDFERAFGRPPEKPIRALVLFTDNDQTRQPVTAYYDWARLYCPRS